MIQAAKIIGTALLFTCAILGLAFAQATELFPSMMAFLLVWFADLSFLQSLDIFIPWFKDSFAFIGPNLGTTIEPNTDIIPISTNPVGSPGHPAWDEVWVETETETQTDTETDTTSTTVDKE